MSASPKQSFSKGLAIGITLIAVISIISLVGLLGKDQSQETKGRAAGADIYFVTDSLSVSPLSSGVYDIYASPKEGAEMVGVVLDISYDPEFISVDSIYGASAMPLLFKSEYTSGKAKVELGVNPANPVTTTTKIATLSFTAKNVSGTTDFSFTSDTEIAILNSLENALLSKTNGQIIIGENEPISTATPVPGRISPTLFPSISPVPTISSVPSACDGVCLSPDRTCLNPGVGQCSFGRVCCSSTR